ncbi:XRE family transcriptional regulator [Catenuloplanes sp. NPDC051500]|uniref:XRE family transcriptional regulator n=1 Tax=Catenuloplanes sp. NPDC051500 TaxID=3363959 RepID=UPI00378D3262
MVRRGVRIEDLADDCGVDPKTVERWISLGRVPHRRHRWTAAKRLGAEEAYLWPEVVAALVGKRADASRAELIEIYPDRASVPRELWLRLLSEAQERIDVLVFSGTFFAQIQPRAAHMLAARLAAGVKVRLCFGDPGSDAVAVRDREERLGGTLAAKIRASLTYYREIASTDGCEIRLHPTTLYNSIFRYDDEVLVNPHVYGEAASVNPTYHFRQVDGGVMFDHYTSGFDRVWETSMPWLGAEV